MFMVTSLILLNLLLHLCHHSSFILIVVSFTSQNDAKPHKQKFVRLYTGYYGSGVQATWRPPWRTFLLRSRVYLSPGTAAINLETKHIILLLFCQNNCKYLRLNRKKCFCPWCFCCARPCLAKYLETLRKELDVHLQLLFFESTP